MLKSAADASIETHLSFSDCPPQAPFPVLPSYEEATGVKDVARLPSYRQSRPAPRTYHPYPRRRAPALVDGTGVDRLMVCLSLFLVSLHHSHLFM